MTIETKFDKGEKDFAEIARRDLRQMSPEQEKALRAYYLDDTGIVACPDLSDLPLIQYSEAALISFGNFLLSEERENNTSACPANSGEIMRRCVTDADLENWKDKQ